MLFSPQNSIIGESQINEMLGTYVVGLTVSGNWSNTQYAGTAVDYTGLSFIAIYSNGTISSVTPTSVSPSVWGSTVGTQTATFTYTENRFSVTVSKDASVEAAIPVSLSITGDWSNPQYVEQAVDYTGLVFTVTYSDGNSSVVTPTSLSPSTWSSTVGTQSCTFSYTENGVTVTATKSASVVSPHNWSSWKNVGGTIFYIHASATGSYEFKNASGTVVSAPSVGTDCTNWTYRYDLDDYNVDKYYVVYNELYTLKRWCPYIDGAYVRVSTGYTATAIGSGKTNTAGIMAIDNGKYIQADSNGYPTVWYQIQQMRTNKVGGCDDWFVGSEYELDALRTSNAGDSATWFSGNHIWSSSETSATNAWFWLFNSSYWLSLNKYGNYCVCGVRAF